MQTGQDIPVFFLPKHCTLGAEDMVSVLLSRGNVVVAVRRESRGRQSGIARLVRPSGAHRLGLVGHVAADFISSVCQ
jgi:hypothetical protein